MFFSCCSDDFLNLMNLFKRPYAYVISCFFYQRCLLYWYRYYWQLFFVVHLFTFSINIAVNLRATVTNLKAFKDFLFLCKPRFCVMLLSNNFSENKTFYCNCQIKFLPLAIAGWKIILTFIYDRTYALFMLHSQLLSVYRWEFEFLCFKYLLWNYNSKK